MCFFRFSRRYPVCWLTRCCCSSSSSVPMVPKMLKNLLRKLAPLLGTPADNQRESRKEAAVLHKYKSISYEICCWLLLTGINEEQTRKRCWYFGVVTVAGQSWSTETAELVSDTPESECVYC